LGSLRFENFFLFFSASARMNPNEKMLTKLKLLPRRIIMATLCTCRWAVFGGENGRELVFSGLAGKINWKVM
jgi:hypothetical protein